MKPTPTDIATAQQILNNRARAGLKVDGDFGRFTRSAAAAWIPWTFRGSPTDDRWTAAVIQKEAPNHKVLAGKFDAWWGPQTDDAADRIRRILTGDTAPLVRPDEIVKTQPGTPCWNPSEAQMVRHYGGVGTNQITVSLPFPMRLDWDMSTTVTRTTLHRLAAPTFLAALEETRDHYGLAALRDLGIDRWGGALNVRKKRGGTTWSMHAWGAAGDFFPTANTLRETARTARFARAVYRPFLDSFARHGWMSLGRCFDFDWMHLQRNPPR